MRRHYFLIFIIFASLTLFFTLSNFDDSNDNGRIERLLALARNQSFCSIRSAQRGFNQSVLSVSAYESNDNARLSTSLTWSFIEIFVVEAKKYYPSWIVRIYHYDLNGKTKADRQAFEDKHDNVDFCDAEQLPVIGNVKNKIPGKMQRFLPAIDPLVSVMNVRDLDSALLEREVHAVNEWLSNSTYAFHIMRDHPQHGIPMLGGMWGLAPIRLSPNERKTIANAILPKNLDDDNRSFFKKYSDRGDQLFLTHYMWPIARYNSLVHDSFFCRWSRLIYRSDTRPFSTRRTHPSCFVGCPKPCPCHITAANYTDFASAKQCPRACRPKNHQDWLFC